MNIKIKKITLKDLDIFYDFFQRAVISEFKEYSEKDREFIFNKGWSKARYESFLKNGNRFILGAWDDEKLVALLDAELPYLGVSFCNWLMVDAKYQKKGIGTKLIREFEDVMKEKGAHMIYLYAGPCNVSYYQKVGYELNGTMKKSWFGQDHSVLTKLLQEPKEENYLK